MFILDQQTVPYADPWLISYEQRLKQLSLRDKRVAYFYETPDTSTFRYRAYNMVQTLQSLSLDISASYFFLSDLNNLTEILALTDVLVICRTRYSHYISQLIASAKARKIKVIFDIDDFVFNPSYVHLILNTLDQDVAHPQAWDHWFAYIGRLGATLKLCDAAITTNEFLAMQIKQFSGKPVSVIPNYLNQEQIKFSEQLFKAKTQSSFQRDQNFCLGYFSGTPTHNKDFGIISSALAQILKANPGVLLRVVGFIDLSGELNNYQSRVELLPLQDFINLQRLIAETEINLVPLQDNIFTNCKSELKFFEAGIVGTVTIASPTFTYSNAVVDGINGHLALSYQWVEKINSAIANFKAYPEMAHAAYQDSLNHYGWHNQLSSIEKALF